MTCEQMRHRPTYTVTDFESPSPSSHRESQPHGICLTVVPKARPRHTLHRTARERGRAMDSRAEGPWIPPRLSCVWLPGGHLEVLCPESSLSFQSFGSRQHLKPPRGTPCELSALCHVSACPGQGHRCGREAGSGRRDLAGTCHRTRPGPRSFPDGNLML